MTKRRRIVSNLVLAVLMVAVPAGMFAGGLYLIGQG